MKGSEGNEGGKEKKGDEPTPPNSLATPLRVALIFYRPDSDGFEDSIF